MDAMSHALLAVTAAGAGDAAAAQAHLATAQQLARESTRRHRQVVEIAALIVVGKGERASGLALVHAAEFPADADLMARITRPGR